MTLFVVGDTDQTLFRFQGAKPEILIRDIDQWLPNIKTVKLETNYRSKDEIIAKSQQLIAHNYADLGGPYPQEMIKNATGVKGEGGAVTFDMYDNADQEAYNVVNTINELLQVDYKPGDVFIGARTNAQLAYIEGALVKAKIPFISLSGGSFWEGRHIGNVIAYLRLAHNTNNEEALKRVYNIPSANHVYTWTDGECKKCKGKGCQKCNNTGFTGPSKFQAGDYCPTRYLGQEFLRKIDYNFNNIDKFFNKIADGWRYKSNAKNYARFGPTKAQDLQEFVWQLELVLDLADNVGQVIEVIISDCYERYLKHEGAGDDGLVNSRLDDLETVRELASQYTSVDDFLAYVDEAVKAAQDAKDKNWNEYVVISTVHRLKGQERRVVFGLGWCEGVCEKSGREVGLLPHTFSLSPPPDFGVLPAGGMSPMEDERCIGFVLVSRAIELCFLSGIASYRTWNMGPSRFIYEMELI